MSFTFFFSSSADHPDLHSFPTRRSSDLPSGLRQRKNYSCEPPSPFRLIGPGCDWSFRRARRGCRQYDGGGNRRNDRGDGVALRRGRCSLTARTKLPDCLQEAATRFMQNRSAARRTLRNSIMPRSRFAATPMSDAGWPPLQACFVPVVDVGLTNKDSARDVRRHLFCYLNLIRFISLTIRFTIAC